MNTKGLFEFINVIYTYDKGQSVVDALCRRKLRFSCWVESMFKKRKAFEACVFTCNMENKDFKTQLLIHENRFKESLEGYAKSKWFDEVYDRKKQPQEFFMQKYHEVRKRQIELALAYIEKIKNPNITTLIESNEGSVEKAVPHFEGYSVQKITELYNFLIGRGYLDAHTPKDDFIYYFTGEGNVPTNGMKWVGKNVDLSILITLLFGHNDERRWKKSEEIFDKKYLRSSYSNIRFDIDKTEIACFVKNLRAIGK